MKIIGLFILLIILVLYTPAYGQHGEILKEQGLKKLSVFLGTWKGENNPGSSNTTTSNTSCGWSLNGRYLVFDQLIDQAGIHSDNLSIYSYDSLHDSYLLSLVGIPDTEPFSIQMTARADTLIYSGSYLDHGKKIFTRTLNIFKRSSLYVFISQYSGDGSSWINTLEGSASKLLP
jgi:hypothetical protein